MKNILLALVVFSIHTANAFAADLNCSSAPINDPEMGMYNIKISLWLDTANRLIEITGNYHGFPDDNPRGLIIDSYQNIHASAEMNNGHTIFHLHEAPDHASTIPADILFTLNSPTISQGKGHFTAQFNNPARLDVDTDLDCVVAGH